MSRFRGGCVPRLAQEVPPSAALDAATLGPLERLIYREFARGSVDAYESGVVVPASGSREYGAGTYRVPFGVVHYSNQCDRKRFDERFGMSGYAGRDVCAVVVEESGR